MGVLAALDDLWMWHWLFENNTAKAISGACLQESIGMQIWYCLKIWSKHLRKIDRYYSTTLPIHLCMKNKRTLSSLNCLHSSSVQANTIFEARHTVVLVHSLSSILRALSAIHNNVSSHNKQHTHNNSGDQGNTWAITGVIRVTHGQ